MQSYNTLKQIESEYLSDFSDERASKVLEENRFSITDALKSDFKTITGEDIIIKDIIIYYDDEDFRQSATAYYLRITFPSDPEYVLAIECLVDFGKIGVKAKTQPGDSGLMKLHEAILSFNDGEGFSELRKLGNLII